MGRQRELHEPMATIPARSRQNGRGIWLYKRSFRHRILRFSSPSATTTSSTLTQKPTRRWHASQAGPQRPRSARLIRLVRCRHPAIISKSLKEQIGVSNAAPYCGSSRRFAQRLVLFSEPERRILSHPDSPPSQTILEIRLRREWLTQYTVLPFGLSLGPPYFYEVHGRGSFPSETDGNPHSQLPRRLAHSGPVRGGTTFTRTLILSHLERLGLRVNSPKAHCLPSQEYRSWVQFWLGSRESGW